MELSLRPCQYQYNDDCKSVTHSIVFDVDINMIVVFDTKFDLDLVEYGAVIGWWWRGGRL